MTDILQEASDLINGQRAQDYGDVTDNFKTIAEMWEAYTGVSFGPHDVSMMMVLVKVARQRHGYHRDSNIDIAGYAALDEKVHGDAQIEDGPPYVVGVDFHLGEMEYPAVPTANTVDWDEFWNDIDVSIAEAATYRPVPRVWDFLNLVPHGVQVTDKWGDVWTHKLGTWGFDLAGDGDWLKADFPPERYDHQCAPYTEVLS